MTLKETHSADKAKSTTASKTVMPLFRVQIKATKDVIYRVRNGQDREYLVTISANGNTGCTQCENDERCPSTKAAGRKCYHIKECLKLEEARVTKDVCNVSAKCPVNDQSVPAICPQDAPVTPEEIAELEEEERDAILVSGTPFVAHPLDRNDESDEEPFSEAVAQRWVEEELSEYDSTPLTREQ